MSKKNRFNDPSELNEPTLFDVEYNAAEARNLWQKETTVNYDFAPRTSSSEVVVNVLPSIETLSRANLEKLESLYREARFKGKIEAATRIIELMHKIGITMPANTDDKNINIIL